MKKGYCDDCGKLKKLSIHLCGHNLCKICSEIRDNEENEPVEICAKCGQNLNTERKK